jgi:nicotinamidase-related amidase
VRLYKADGSNADLCRKAVIEAGAAILRPRTDGAELAAELLPPGSAKLDTERLLAGGVQQLGEREFVIYKPRWGAFFHTPLEEHLRSLGVSSLAFSGCNFPNCPRTSIYEASERDFRVALVVDAISGLYDRGRQELANIGVDLVTTDALVAAVEAVRRQPERA